MRELSRHLNFKIIFIYLNRNGLATDDYLRVKGTHGTMYALGDCSVVEQEKLTESIDELFNMADKDKDGTLSLEEFSGITVVIVICLYIICTTKNALLYRRGIA